MFFAFCIYYLYYNYLLVYMESFFSEKLEAANYSLILLLIQKLQITKATFSSYRIVIKFFKI